jgi:hypothetical protein
MQFLDIIYNVLVSPSQEFRVISKGPVPKDTLFAYATLIVFLVSGVGALYSPFVNSTDGLVLRVMFSCISGLIFWIFTGSVFSMAAYVFGERGRPQTILILTAYATLPWIFLPIIMLFKGFLGAIGHSIAIFALLGLWLWSSVLFLIALKATYNLSLERIILVACLPILMTFLGLAWFGGFLLNTFKFFMS